MYKLRRKFAWKSWELCLLVLSEEAFHYILRDATVSDKFILKYIQLPLQGGKCAKS